MGGLEAAPWGTQGGGGDGLTHGARPAQAMDHGVRAMRAPVMAASSRVGAAVLWGATRARLQSGARSPGLERFGDDEALDRDAQHHGRDEPECFGRTHGQPGQGRARAVAGESPAHSEDGRAGDESRIDVASRRQVECPGEDRACAAKDRVVSTAPPSTKARVGSKSPVTSRKPRMRRASVMPESARPSPNSPPEAKAATTMRIMPSLRRGGPAR